MGNAFEILESDDLGFKKKRKYVNQTHSFVVVAAFAFYYWWRISSPTTYMSRGSIHLENTDSGYLRSQIMEMRSSKRNFNIRTTTVANS